MPGRPASVHAGAPDECLRRARVSAVQRARLRAVLVRARGRRARGVRTGHPAEPRLVCARSVLRRHFVGRRWLRAAAAASGAPARARPGRRRDRRQSRSTTRCSAARDRPPSRSFTGSTTRRARSDATKQRILFEAASPLSLVVSRPVLEILSPRPAPRALVHDERRRVGPGVDLRAAGLTGPARVAGVAARWMKFDAYINTDFWNMTWLPRRTRRIHLFHGVAGKYGLDAPTRIAPVVSTFDRLMFPESRSPEALRGRRPRRSGQPGRRARSATRRSIAWSTARSIGRPSSSRLGLDPSAPTVLYAPTWSPYSSLNDVGRVDHRSRWRSARRQRHRQAARSLVRPLGPRVGRRRLAEPDRAASARVTACTWRRTSTSHRISTSRTRSSPITARSASSSCSSIARIVVVDCPELIAKARVNPGKVGVAAQRRRCRAGGRRRRRRRARALTDPSRLRPSAGARSPRSSSTGPAAPARAPFSACIPCSVSSPPKRACRRSPIGRRSPALRCL